MPKTKAKKKTPAGYGAGSIRQLKGLEAVRERPGMFLGDPSSGDALHHLLWEVVDNSVDEHLAGHCTHIHIELLDDGWCQVADNGRGIPVGPHPTEGIDTLELVMTSLHAGGKFDADSYEQSAGLHGVGVSAVNAVSELLVVRVCRDGRLWEQSYAIGVPIDVVRDLGPSHETGTTIRWLRDLSIFSGVIEYDRKIVDRRLEELAFLNPGLTIVLSDVRPKKTEHKVFHFAGGIKEYITKLIGKRKVYVPALYFRDHGPIETAFAWTTSGEEVIRCYSNNTFNGDGGTHMTGFRNGLTRLVTHYAKEHNLLKGLNEGSITGADIREGIVAVVNVRMSGLSFSSQTKDKLVTPKARAYVEDLFKDQIEDYFRRNPAVAKKVAEKAVISAKAREAAKRAREQVLRKDLMDRWSLPGKLADCSSKNPDECELFIVEGDSAGGSAKSARDRAFQAILPLRGKVLNTERASLDILSENKELTTLIATLGCGIEQTGSFDMRKLRYHKIIIMTDADVDGEHIRTLLLTFFYRCTPRLVHEGYIYIAQPPLFGLRFGGAKTEFYFSTGEECASFLEKQSDSRRKMAKRTRYKGLGEMNPEDLWITTLNPENRVLRPVTVSDAVEAEILFSTLMGADVEARRAWLGTNAQYAGNLDI